VMSIIESNTGPPEVRVFITSQWQTYPGWPGARVPRWRVALQHTPGHTRTTGHRTRNVTGRDG
jgi:hypothetical protein